MGKLLLIRHGQASFGAANYDLLSPLGEEQSRALGSVLRSRISPDLVITGSLRRHQQTAAGCLSAFERSAEIREHKAFDEYDHEEIIARHRPEYADCANMLADFAKTPHPRRAFQAMFSEAMKRWLSGQHDHDYTESWSAFEARALSALEHTISTLGPGKTALVFTSGGPIAVIAQHLLHVPREQGLRLAWGIANCSITKVLYNDQGPTLASFNEHGHLEGEGGRLLTYR
jgi:broad specificity phosphatase PhoE